MNELQGNLITETLRGRFTVLVHGCNCYGVMGAGLAKQVAEAFPEAQSADRATPVGMRGKLGTCSIGMARRDDRWISIVNAYTQLTYWGPQPRADYGALERAMRWVADAYRDRSIGVPLIGAGLGGLEEARVRVILNECFEGIDATLVIFKR